MVQEECTMPVDPVCGMEVDPKAAKGTSEYEGETYYFCAPGCKRAFDADPKRYIAAEGEEHEGH